MTRQFLSLLLLLTTAGCVSGRVHTFNYVPQETSTVGAGRTVLVLPTDDQRSYVVSGDEPPEFVGEQRNGYGMPFNVTTADRRPFSLVVQETVKRDLEAAGFHVITSPNKSDIRGELQRTSAERALAIVMREFKSDTMNNINFDFDFEALVYDISGAVIAQQKVAGEEVLPGSLMNPMRAAREKVPAHFYQKIHQLITGNSTLMKALMQ